MQLNLNCVKMTMQNYAKCGEMMHTAGSCHAETSAVICFVNSTEFNCQCVSMFQTILSSRVFRTKSKKKFPLKWKKHEEESKTCNVTDGVCLCMFFDVIPSYPIFCSGPRRTRNVRRSPIWTVSTTTLRLSPSKMGAIAFVGCVI